jgi:hypothetical protein
MMTCEDFELELGAPTLSAAARAHLEGCATCQDSYEVVALAALPDVTAAEREALLGLSTGALRRWRATERRRERLSRIIGLTLAAGLGAVVAAGVMWKLRPAVTQPTVQPVAATTDMAEPVVPDWTSDGFNPGDDEVFWEVSWPALTEGDL